MYIHMYVYMYAYIHACTYIHTYYVYIYTICIFTYRLIACLRCMTISFEHTSLKHPPQHVLLAYS